MSWQDRLREAAYTSPSGVRLTFDYEQTSEAFDQKATPYDFADADGTFVQTLGRTGRRYALRLIVWGNNYDLEASEWMTALAESGQGLLEHPVYGRLDVVPVGTVRRRDDLVVRANQAIIEVEFFETIGLIYPTGNADPLDSVDSLVDEAGAAQAAQLAESGVLDTAVGRSDFLGSYNAALDVVESVLDPIASTGADAQRQFDAIQKSINRGIDVLIRQPLTLAFQTQQLINTPARIVGQVSGRIDSYGSLFTEFVDIPVERETQLQNNDMYLSGLTTATALATTTTEYSNRHEAIEAAEKVLEQGDALAEWRDTNYAALEVVDTGGSWQATQELIAVTAGALIELSFGLAQERRVVLGSARSIIDLSYELYGTVDSRLDALINDNNLSGDEIIELPQGKEVVYYVA
jgi:prophage DNA circulation protein